ncbi:glycolate oxidase subunit GlcF [Candidatus Spongiihabitans sp.]|uniref:glycolate oxidase subunit GlcF n=1 Tax=Candidatus Spongiihabitans sp. TaxID=3101308 RepID=UPI003C6F3FA2
MQTSLTPEFADTAKGKEAEAIIRKCVHCGFCNATCPTYQLLGDELDGPRGRIYLMKQLLEGEQANDHITLHLDRCLTCRACETTCPSGVEYGKLLAIGHSALHMANHRSLVDQLSRIVVAKVVGNARIFDLLLNFGRAVRPILPASLKSRVPASVTPANAGSMPIPEWPEWPKRSHKRTMVALAGCVQGALSPMTNLAAAVVLDKLGITLIEAAGAGCCGAVDLHTTSESRAKKLAKALIDEWWPYLAQGIEGFVMTASGCGVTIMEYPHLFQDEPDYLEKAKAVSGKTVDLCEVIDKEMCKGMDKEIDPVFRVQDTSQKVAFHSPCTLQHGQKITGTVEKILQRVGYQLCKVEDPHLCCGSAGTYSIFQPGISSQLRQAKLRSLYNDNPNIVCTANVGCQAHLNMNGHAKVKHWVELLL